MTAPELTVVHGEALAELRRLPAESVQCCVTSPPYYGLRDYGLTPHAWEPVRFLAMAGMGLSETEVPAMSCCLGLEPTLAAFLGHTVAIFREVRRVLKKDGTLWLNFGDSYNSNAGGYTHEGSMGVSHNKRLSKKTMGAVVKDKHRMRGTGLKPKDLMGVPWRVALALQADGWYLRSDIIWHKPNPMPESVIDRPTKSHEYLFLLSTNADYYYDAEAILEPVSKGTHARMSQNVQAQIGSARANGGAKTNGNMKAVLRGVNPKALANSPGNKQNSSFSEAVALPVSQRNKRTVWTVPTFSFTGAHFATYPPDLVKPCILAGSRPGDIILDPFGGSGTTGEVALSLGRSALLIELGAQNLPLIAQRCAITPGLGI